MRSHSIRAASPQSQPAHNLAPGQVLWLSRQDVLDAGGGDMALATQAVGEAFTAWRAGQALQPAKTSLRLAHKQQEAQAGVVNVLPAAVATPVGTVFGVKALGAMPGNVAQSVPRATGTITLFDDAHKMPIAIMDAQVISAMRTGAVSALAAPKLARTDARSLGCVGAGVNMMTQIRGLLHALPGLDTIRIYSRGASKHQLAERLHQRYPALAVSAVDSAEAAVAAADIVITCAANVNQPVVPLQAVNRPGVTICNIGCLENEPQLLAHMDVIVSDNWQQSKHRGVQTHAVAFSQGIIADSDVTNLGDILAGQAPGRTTPAQKVFFGPTGLGIEDISLAAHIYTQALARGCGTVLSLWSNQPWI